MSPTVHRLIGTFVPMVIAATNLFAQIQNAGFENWTVGYADDWNVTGHIPPNIEQSVDARSGQFAAYGEYRADSAGNPYPTFLWQQITTSIQVDTGQTDSLVGWYKFFPENSFGELHVFVEIQDSLGNQLGTGTWFTSVEQTSFYDQFVAPIQYFSNGTAASYRVDIFINHLPATPSLGSWFLIDDLHLDHPVSLDERIKNRQDIIVYPNPSRGKFSVQSFDNELVDIQVVDPTGRVMVRNPEVHSGNLMQFDLSHVSLGLYFVTIDQGYGRSQTIPIIVE